MKRLGYLTILIALLVLGTVTVVMASSLSELIGGTDSYTGEGETHIVLPSAPQPSMFFSVGGPIKVKRQDPVVPTTTIPPAPVTIPIEIIEMELVGSSPIPIKVTPRPIPLPPIGEITEITPGIDFPAESFFDVFFDVEIPSLPPSLQNLHTNDPIHIQSQIDSIPHDGALYEQQPPGPVQLFDETETPVGTIEVLGLTFDQIPPTGANTYWQTIAGISALIGGLALLLVRKRSNR